MRRLTRPLALLLVGATVATACANPSDAERDTIAAALDEYAATAERASGPDLGLDLDDEIDPFGLEVDRSTGDDRGIGTVSRDTDRAPIEQFRCPFASDLVTPSRCGKIELPGRGADPDYTIELAFVRFSATGDEDEIRPDPVVFLHGGPGGSVLDEADLWYDTVVAPHIEVRDVILYDQRGGGRSTAPPTCVEVLKTADRFYEEAIRHEDLSAQYVADLATCGARLEADPAVDLTAFNSAANAQDLVDLMWALGIETYNIHGSSYGTRLAQTVMRDAPDGVRSLILSGVYPIEENLMGSVATSLEHSLDAVFTACAATPDCADALPDPWAALESLVDDLDGLPLQLEVGAGFGIYRLRFDGTDLLNGLHNFLYSADGALSVPDILIDYRDGDDRRLRRLATNSVFDHADVATFLTVQCADEAAFTTPADLLPSLDHEFLRSTDLAPSINGSDALAICDTWNVATPGPIENEPVTWDIPTLLLAGALDPITPNEWAEALAARLPRARLVVDPIAAHDADDGGCALRIIGDFVEHPDLLFDTGCTVNADTLVRTRAERFQEPFEMRDWSYDLDGDDEYFDARAPDWAPVHYADVQIFWRDLGPLDPTSVVVIPGNNSYDPLSHLVVYESSTDWQLVGASGVLGWSRSEIQLSTGTLVRLENMITEVQVVLVTEIGEQDDLENEVLNSVAESIGENQ